MKVLDLSTGICIPFNTASSKNSKRWTGRMLINSKTVMTYKANTRDYYIKQKDTFLKEIEGKEFPLNIGLYFVRDSKRKFDYINISQIVFDMMQEYDWVDDDDMSHITPSFLGYEVDKAKAGVYIFIL